MRSEKPLICCEFNKFTNSMTIILFLRLVIASFISYNTPMIKLLFLNLCLLCTCLAGDKEEVEAFVKNWADIFNKNEAKAMNACYEDSDDVQMLVSAGLTMSGIEEIKGEYNTCEKELVFYDSEIDELKVRVLGNTAISSFIHQFKYEILETGEHYKIHIRTTNTLLKTKKGWKIIQEHSSPIKGIPRAELITS